MRTTREDGGRGDRSLIVFTDLDGCLLEEATYRFEAAAEALAALSRAGVPLVPVTSKTRLEVEALARDLGLTGPSIVENGGAIVAPRDLVVAVPPGARVEGDVVIVPLGVPRANLVAALRDISRETKAPVRGFATLPHEEIHRLTNLEGESLERALAREYDEPFVPDDDLAIPRLTEAAAARGFKVTRGGRFCHLTGRIDKGQAVTRLLELVSAGGRRFTSVALGDSPNDLEMLAAVDRPIVIPRPDGRPDPAIAAGLPLAERAPHPGPRGWNQAVLAVLGGGRLPRVAETEEAKS